MYLEVLEFLCEKWYIKHVLFIIFQLLILILKVKAVTQISKWLFIYIQGFSLVFQEDQ